MRRAALALQDLILLAYLGVVTLLFRLRSPGPSPVFWQLLGGTVLLATTAVVARTATRLPHRLRLGVYRVVIVTAIVWSYVLLRDVLPVVRPDAVDATLAAADAHLFGVEPTLWLERLNHAPVVEWLSFFYFNYYTLMLAFVIGVLFVEGPGPSADTFGIGTALLFSLGHLGYMAVPAFGPVVHYAGRYQGPLQGGPFLHLVLASVEGGGAMKDVFPSMHTGGSVWFALFALHRARQDRRWRVPAALAAFTTANIVVSTVVLRWHYAVDVLAGITLASAVAYVAVRLAPWEAARRKRLGLPGGWTFE
jgi:membrane-associated phospholipid phosphatase